MPKTEFLTYLSHELIQYNLIPNTDRTVKHAKKQFINGLMTASRYLGVSFEELQTMIDSQPSIEIEQSLLAGIDTYFDVPTVMRADANFNIAK